MISSSVLIELIILQISVAFSPGLIIALIVLTFNLSINHLVISTIIIVFLTSILINSVNEGDFAYKLLSVVDISDMTPRTVASASVLKPSLSDNTTVSPGENVPT